MGDSGKALSYTPFTGFGLLTGDEPFGGNINSLTGSKSKNQTVTQITEPWLWQQPYLRDIYSRAAAGSGTPMEYYPGRQVASFTPQEMLAHTLTTQRALGGSPVTAGAKGALGDIIGGARTPDEMGLYSMLGNTVSGGYLSPETNPWLRQTYQLALNEALPQISSAAQRYGAYGSSDYDALRAKTAADIATNIYGGAYGAERGYQMQGAGLLGDMIGAGRTAQLAGISQVPTFEGLDYMNLAQLQGVGQDIRGLSQQEIEAEKNKWSWQQMEPWQRLQMYSGLVGNPTTGVTQTTSPYYSPSPVSGAMGGAALGGSMAMIPGMSPYAWPLILAGAGLGMFS